MESSAISTSKSSILELPEKSVSRLSLLRTPFNIKKVTNDLEASNDDEERAHRRQEVELQKRLSNIPQISYNDATIEEQYNMCTHLYAENKINTKNAWKLQIINMLEPLCQKPGRDTLQVAGTSMDICAKVYGLRVDDVHAESLKLATNLARTANANSQEMENNDDNEDEVEGQARSQKKQKKNKNRGVNLQGIKNTVSRNPSSLCGPLPKLEPTDFTTRVKAETGTIENLLTNILRENNTSYSFVIFDKGEKLFDDKDELVETNYKNHMIELSNLLPLESCNIEINRPFKNFKIEKDYDSSQENSQFEADRSQTLGKVAVDDDGFPIYELDGSLHDDFIEQNLEMDEDNVEEVIEIAPQLRGHLERITDFAPQKLSAEMSEYSYNTIINTRTGKFIDQIWAGPSHWKLKFIRRTGPKFSGVHLERKIPSSKKRTEPDLINFDEEIEFDLTTKISTRKPQTVDPNKITLPCMSLTMMRTLSTLENLALRPNVRPVEKKFEKDEKLECDVSNYNYENPNDSNYCVQNLSNIPDDDNIGDNNANVDDEKEFHKENLVEGPEMVTLESVSYATKAKQIDMKKLKSAIWHHLLPSKANAQSVKTIRKTTFSKIYEQLPNLLPQKDKQELSCSLAFVALLHLCNEHNLKLIQHPEQKDFDIDLFSSDNE